MCPTPTGHMTDRPNKFNVGERELAKRKILNAAIAEELSRPLIATDLLTTAQRAAMPADIRRAITERKRLIPRKQHFVHTHSRWRPWQPPKGLGSYRAGTSKKPTKTVPRWERRIGADGWPTMTNGNQVRDHLGERGFRYWRLMGTDAQFCGRLAADMSRDELLAFVGWTLKGFWTWRHAYLIRTDRRYKSSVLGASAERVTAEMKADDKPLPKQWLGANETMTQVIGNHTDRREGL